MICVVLILAIIYLSRIYRLVSLMESHSVLSEGRIECTSIYKILILSGPYRYSPHTHRFA